MLFSALWPDVDRPGVLTIWLAPSKLSVHVPFCKFPLTAEDYAELRAHADVNKQDVYFGIGARREGLKDHQQGGKKDIISMPGVVMDIDFAHPTAHKAKNLPPDLESIIPLLVGLPCPSAVVLTGHGVHLYWFFDKPLELHTPIDRRNANEAFARFQAVIIARGAEQGWHIDQTATINRVWRVPGFANQKSGAEVTLLECDPTARYPVEALGFTRSEQLPVVAPAVAAPVPVTPTIKPPVNVDEMTIALRALGPQNTFHREVKLMLAGQSFADPGDRDRVLQGICSTMAWMPEGRKCDAYSIAEIMRPALAVWAAEPNATRTLDEEIQKAADKIERSQEDWHAQQEQKRPALDALARALGLADPKKTDTEVIEQHAIIQKRSTFYAFNFTTGAYSHPLAQNELMTYLREAWKDGPIKTHWVDTNGKKKRRSLEDVLDRNSMIAERIAGDLTIEDSWFDAEKSVFYEAMAKRRVTQARFDPQIDHWLRLLGGPHAEKLLDWLASVPMLQHQTCALYLSRKSGAGKGLLANGISRIWTDGGPTPFTNVIGNFNNDLIECPFIFADEGIPQRYGNVSVEFRSIVGSSTFTLNEKYVVTRKVSGATRLMIAANNENAISFANEYLGMDDLEAITRRILHIPACEEAAEWLDANNTHGALTHSWVEGDRIAQHVLHLSQTRVITPGKRFLVEGEETDMHRHLLTDSGDLDSVVFEWLVRYASNPGAISLHQRAVKNGPHIFIGDDSVLVNTQCMIDCWDVYMKDIPKPSPRRAGKVLAKLSTNSDTRLKHSGRVRYHTIAGALILDWCTRNQVGNEDAIESALQTPLSFPPDPNATPPSDEGEDESSDPSASVENAA